MDKRKSDILKHLLGLLAEVKRQSSKVHNDEEYEGCPDAAGCDFYDGPEDRMDAAADERESLVPDDELGPLFNKFPKELTYALRRISSPPNEEAEALLRACTWVAKQDEQITVLKRNVESGRDRMRSATTRIDKLTARIQIIENGQ